MDIHQIDIVLSVAKSLSFSEAAFETYSSLSNVSKKVTALEHELGVRIFERGGRSKVSLTPLGERLVPYFRRLSDDARELLDCRDSLLDLKNNRISIACPNGLSTLGEDEAIVEFTGLNPDLTVEVLTAEKEPVFRLLEDNRADVAFSVLGGEDFFQENRDAYSIVELSFLELKVMIKSGHPAIKNGMVELAGLKDETFLFRDLYNCASTKSYLKIQQFTEACRSEGFEPKIKLVSMRSSTVFEMAGSGMGVVLLMFAPKTAYPGTELLPLTKTYYSNTLTLCFRKDNSSQALQRFVSFMKQRLS